MAGSCGGEIFSSLDISNVPHAQWFAEYVLAFLEAMVHNLSGKTACPPTVFSYNHVQWQEVLDEF